LDRGGIQKRRAAVVSGPIGKAWRGLELKDRKPERQWVAADQNVGHGEASLLLVDFPWPLPGLLYIR
jgi:hypothetical protein